MPVVEAMACGVPCVVVFAPVARRGVRGRGGARRSRQPRGVAEGIRRALADREELVVRGLDQARRFSWLERDGIHLQSYADAL